MTGSITFPRRALLVGLSPELVDALAGVLRRCSCEVVLANAPVCELAVDVVFCPGLGDYVHHARHLDGGTPIIAVTASPDRSGWLDALEAGACDYCTPPFEPSHIGWLLDRHAPPRRAFVAA